jgi:hypothetical protein
VAGEVMVICCFKKRLFFSLIWNVFLSLKAFQYNNILLTIHEKYCGHLRLTSQTILNSFMKMIFSAKCKGGFLSSLLLFLGLLGTNIQTYATHVIGGDLSYKYTGTGNIYTINLNIYGDCSGASFAGLDGSTHIIDVYHGTTLAFSLTTSAFGSGTEVTPVCPSLSGATRCSSTSSTIPGIKIFNATANVTLPPASDWRIVFDGDNSGAAGAARLGRSNAIGNIVVGSTGSIIHLEATLNNSSSQNSSPVFGNTTPPYYCLANTIYNPAASDADGDSLSLALVPAIDAATGSSATYNSGYSPTTPISSSTGCTLNSSTGQLSFTPNIVQISCVDYKITEIRSGVVVGTSMREMNFVILPCSNNPPSATPSTIVGGKKTSTYTLSTCNGTTFSFKLAPTDPEGDKITMSTSGLPSGASFSVVGNGGAAPIASFSWNTTGVSPGTYIFYINYKDDACPLSYSQTIAYSIVVNSSPTAPKVISPLYYCLGATASPLTATGTNLLWYSTATGGSGSTMAPTPITTAAATYYVSQTTDSTLGSCESMRGSIAVNINPTPTAPIVITPISYCKNATATALTATGTNLQWYTTASGGIGVSTAPTPNTSSIGTANYYVSQTATVPGSCESNRAMINAIVDTTPLKPSIISPTYLCLGATAVPLNATITTIGSTILWYNVATGGIGTSLAPTPSTSVIGTTNYYASQTCPFIGTDGPRAVIVTTVRPLPTVLLSPVGLTDYALCKHDSTTLSATAASGTLYQWSWNLINIPGATAATLKVGLPGNYGIIIKDTFGCTNNSNVSVFNDTLLVPNLSPTNLKICDGVTVMLYCTPASIGYKYEWLQNSALITSAGTSSASFPVSVASNYSVRITDLYGCVDTTNVSILSTYPSIIKPTLLRLDPILKVNNIYAKYQWYRNNNPIAGANANTFTMLYDGNYFAEVSDGNDCSKYSDTISVVNLSVGNVNAQQNELLIYPNPSTGKFIVQYSQLVNVDVLDMFGQIILQQKDSKELDLQQFPDGMYLLHVTNSKDGSFIKFEKVQKNSKHQ